MPRSLITVRSSFSYFSYYLNPFLNSPSSIQSLVFFLLSLFDPYFPFSDNYLVPFFILLFLVDYLSTFLFCYPISFSRLYSYYLKPFLLYSLVTRFHLYSSFFFSQSSFPSPLLSSNPSFSLYIYYRIPLSIPLFVIRSQLSSSL